MNLKSIVKGTDDDLAHIRDVRRLIQATSDRETVRRMAIFCRELLTFQKEKDAQIVLCKKGLPDKVVWFV